MDCPKCGFDNPSASSFCNKCGAQISPIEELAPAITETIQIPVKELAPGSTFAKRYQIIEELGKGGMGRVYKVLDKEIGEKVALKLLNPEIAADSKTIERFRSELKTARQISHKNVCRMYHLSKEEGAPYIIMGGEYDKAFDQIEYLLSIPDELSVPLLKLDPVGAPLRALPRFHKLVEKYGGKGSRRPIQSEI